MLHPRQDRLDLFFCWVIPELRQGFKQKFKIFKDIKVIQLGALDNRKYPCACLRAPFRIAEQEVFSCYGERADGSFCTIIVYISLGMGEICRKLAFVVKGIAYRIGKF